METRWSTIALIWGFFVFMPSNSIMPKPGNCPPTLIETFVALPPCNSDRDCNGDEKCCVYFSRSMCVPPVPIIRGCPPYRGEIGTCDEACSSDSDCPNPGELCCSNGCGHACRQSIPIKPGRCGHPKFDLYCRGHCEHDGYCRGSQKCCPSNCGGTCSDPK